VARANPASCSGAGTEKGSVVRAICRESFEFNVGNGGDGYDNKS